MAVQFDIDTEFLSRTANLPTGAATVCLWSYMTSDLNTFTPMIFISDATGTDAIRYVQIGSTADGTSFVGEIHVSTSTGAGWSDTGVITNISVNTWYFWALSWSSVSGAVTLRCHARAASASSLTSGSVGATWSGTFAPASFRLARDVGIGLYNGRFEGRIGGIKMWDAELTAAELLLESRQLAPVRRANARNCYPLWSPSHLADHGPNSHAWTTNGSPTAAEGPPVPWKAGAGRRVYVPAAAPVGGNRRRRVIMGAAT